MKFKPYGSALWLYVTDEWPQADPFPDGSKSYFQSVQAELVIGGGEKKQGLLAVLGNTLG